MKPEVVEDVVTLTLEVVRRARAGSSLQKWWHQVHLNDLAVWQRSVAYLGRRIQDGPDATP